jgi:hypothetical protein
MLAAISKFQNKSSVDYGGIALNFFINLYQNFLFFFDNIYWVLTDV